MSLLNNTPARTYAEMDATGNVASVLDTNKVIRNTYILLSMTLAFAAVSAGTAMALNLPHPGLIITLVGYFGLLFATMKLRNSGWALVSKVISALA